MSIQGLGGLDQELGSNEHVLGISSVGPYPTTSMNHANLNAFPPARYSVTMPVGCDVPPHLVTTVGVYLPVFIPHLLMVALLKGPRGHQGDEGQRQLDGYLTPEMTQRIPFAPGPPRFEYDAPAITVRVPSPRRFSLEFTACPTVSLTIGDSQRRPPQSGTSPLQCSGAFPRKSQYGIFRSASHRRPQKSC